MSLSLFVLFLFLIILNSNTAYKLIFDHDCEIQIENQTFKNKRKWQKNVVQNVFIKYFIFVFDNNMIKDTKNINNISTPD